MKNKSKYPLVLIEWEDSQLGFQGWKFIDKQAHEVPYIHSVGYLIKSTKTHKVLYPHINISPTQSESGSGDILIPTSAIKKITLLTGGKSIKP
jgi:hypothetical protein